jgi:hypothetical protein
MPLEIGITLLLFAASAVFAFRRGGPPEQLAATIIVSWLLASVLYQAAAGPASFVTVDPARFALDTAELVAISVLALRANRMWPLWAAAAQVICVSGHVAALIEPDGMRRAYWVMTQVPPFIQVIALVLGAHAHALRSRRLGRYRSWRYQ